LVEFHRRDEGESVRCHLPHGARCCSGRAADSGVVEGDDAPPVRCQRVDQRGIPAVKISAEMLEEDQRRRVAGAGISVAVGVVNAIPGTDQFVRKLRVSNRAAMGRDGGHAPAFLLPMSLGFWTSG